jgi:hypothetical protein
MMHPRYKKNRRVVIMVVIREEDTKGVPEVDMGVNADKDKEEGEVVPPLVLIVEIMVMYQSFVPKRTCFMHTIISQSMSLKFPDLMK